MSDSEPESSRPLAIERLSDLVEGWVETLGQLLEVMAGKRPQVRWRAFAGAAADAAGGPDSEVLWWEQRFSLSDAAVWVGAPRQTWDYTAALLLKAAGLETLPEGEAQKTWQEILSQWLSGLARSLGPMAGQEVTCGAGAEHAPPANQQEWALVSLSFEGKGLPPLAVTFSAPLLAQLTKPAAAAPAADEPAAVDAAPVRGSRTMELLLDVELPVSISFGRTELALKDVLKLTTGSIVELNRSVNEPVDILVNHSLIARGEVVVVDGNYGVRIQRIISRQERLRSLH